MPSVIGETYIDEGASQHFFERGEYRYRGESVILSSQAKNLGLGGHAVMVREYYFYLMASYRRALYAGVTNDLTVRAYEHNRRS